MSKFTNKLNFEADTMNITPFDFSRLVFIVETD